MENRNQIIATTRWSILILMLLTLFTAQLSFADEAENAVESDVVVQEPDEYERLNNIRNNIDDLEKRKVDLEKELKTETDEERIEEIKRSLEQITNQRTEFNILFEKIALGGIDTARFDSPTSITLDTEAYDWQKELILIMQPVFTEMQRLTEGPRKRELLRNEKKELEERIAIADAGLDHINSLSPDKLSPEALEKLKSNLKDWEDLRDNLDKQVELVTLKLNDITDDSSVIERISNSVTAFFKGRGLILIVSFGVFFGLLYIFSAILAFFGRLRRKNGKAQPIAIRWRVALLAYQIGTYLIAIFTLLTMIHSSGDMVLFGLAILILFVIIISLRGAIPSYLRKLRLYLNLGQAREGERIIYNGLPWQIEHINLYTVYLINPALDNGRIRLTVDILNNMISRPVRMDEIWFPTKVGDTLFLNGTNVKVLRQTPEAMYLDSFSSRIIYPTADFLAAKPTNITTGYSMTVNFGLSHEHYDDLVITDVIAIIRKQIEDNTIYNDPDMERAINSITVDFREIDEASTMIYTVIVGMGANAQGYYYSLPRLIHRLCVEVAQKEGWKIPYSEMFVQHINNVPLEEFNREIEEANLRHSTDKDK